MGWENSFQDHLGRNISLAAKPHRIVSLCPSITETLYSLGLDKEIVGRTRFCIHPEERVKSATRVGGTKEIKYDRLHQLKPDLIIAEKEENTPEMVAELEKKYPVFVVDVKTVEGGYRMISDLASLCQQENEGNKLLEKIKAEEQEFAPSGDRLSVAYFIWKEPYMVVGADTYIQSMLEWMKLDNVFLNNEGRYPRVDKEEIASCEADWIFLSSEPYPFKEKHIEEFRTLSTGSEIKIVDGEMFSWYGSRMELAFPYLRSLRTKLEKEKSQKSS